MTIEFFLSLLGCLLGFVGCALAFVAFFMPAQVLELIVRRPDHWVKIEYLPGYKDVYRHKYLSGFMIEVDDENDNVNFREGFEEGWLTGFSNYHKESNCQIPVICSFNGLPLRVETFIRFDEFRWFVPLPKRKPTKLAFRYGFLPFQKRLAEIVGKTNWEDFPMFFSRVERYSEVHLVDYFDDEELSLKLDALAFRISEMQKRYHPLNGSRL